MMSISLIFIPLLDWAHKSHEFTRHDPVEVSIFDSLIVLVFLHVEGSEIVPPKFHGILQALKALEQGAIVVTVSFRGISIVLKQPDIITKLGISFLSGVLLNYDHEGTHKECAIHHFVWLFTRTIVENSIVRIVLILQESCELS